MADLSPAAQAVRGAVLATYADNIPKNDSLWNLERASTVAALRAAADQVVPAASLRDRASWSPFAGKIRSEILAIAAELEAQP